MWPFFAVIFILDLLLLFASNMADQSWASAVCSFVIDLCNFSLTLKVVAVLSFGLTILTREF
jgi:hypothetical protein